MCYPLWCPVRQWDDVVQQIWTYLGRTRDAKVNTDLIMDRRVLFTAKNALKNPRATVAVICKDVLGFESYEIGLHPLRSGAAMVMYLTNIPVYTIMLIGRWSSDAFMRYIRRQFKEFSAGVSSAMIPPPRSLHDSSEHIGRRSPHQKSPTKLQHPRQLWYYRSYTEHSPSNLRPELITLFPASLVTRCAPICE
jgi:hypothetical protein